MPPSLAFVGTHKQSNCNASALECEGAERPASVHGDLLLLILLGAMSRREHSEGWASDVVEVFAAS
jgi:hypothetical protein